MRFVFAVLMVGGFGRVVDCICCKLHDNLLQCRQSKGVQHTLLLINDDGGGRFRPPPFFHIDSMNSSSPNSTTTAPAR